MEARLRADYPRFGAGSVRIGLFLVLLSVNSAIMSTTLYPFATSAQELRFNSLLHELRCLVCQNQDLADSNAKLAQDLRAEVYRLVRANRSNDAIITYLTARYGDFILFKPP